MDDLIFVSMEDWDEVWRRNQFVCAELTKRFPKMRILFVGLTLDVSNQVRRGIFSGLRQRTSWTLPELPNITFMKPLKLLPNSLPAARRLNEWHMRAQVRKTARQLRLKSPLLWLNPHSTVHMAGAMDERGVIYDITDDWMMLTQSETLTNLIRAQDAELCRKADDVIVCSQRLFDLKRDLARRLHLIPNGVDAAHYRCVLDGTGPLPEEARGWAHPVFGYTGTIHPDRVDIGMVEELARGLETGSIVLVGPDMLPPTDQARIRALGNVFMTDSVPYARLPQFMRAFDVCITPHRMTPFTESLNPIKLWEYLAAGKPIVSTDIAGFRDYSRFVTIARSAAEFGAAMTAALSEAAELGQERRREAARHSWDARLNDIIAVMEQAREPAHRSAKP